MPDKLTDSEIVKALKDTLHRIKGAKHLIVPKEGVENLCNGLENALNLINRLQAELDNYSHNVRTMTKTIRENQSLIDTLVKTCKTQKAENERLKNSLAISKKETKRFQGSYKTAKAEAYKECIEKVKEKSCKLNMCHNDIVVKTDYQISDENLDNLLKELVGDNNET